MLWELNVLILEARVPGRKQHLNQILSTLQRANYLPRYDAPDSLNQVWRHLCNGTHSVVICSDRLPVGYILAARELVERGGFDLPFVIVRSESRDRATMDALEAGLSGHVITCRLDQLNQVILASEHHRAARARRSARGAAAFQRMMTG